MPYLTPAQVRDRQPRVADLGDASDAEITRLVSEFEVIAEEFCGIGYTTRAVTDEFTRPGFLVVLRTPPVVSITSFTVDGTAGTVADIVLDKLTGEIINGGWQGSDVLSVTYQAGVATVTEPLLRACAEYVRCCLSSDRSGQSRDVIAQSFDGGITRYSTPDWAKGRPTGWLEVDRLLVSVGKRRAPGLA